MRSFSEVLADTIENQDAAREVTATTRTIDDAFAHALFVTTAATPAWASELGVAYPCSADDLRRAFRRRALETHPDRLGGSSDAFLASTRALEQGLADLAVSPRRIAAQPFGAQRSAYRRAA